MREWLNRYRYQWYRVEDLIAGLNNNTRAARYDGMPRAHNIRGVDDDIIHREIISEELERELDKLKQIREEITLAIDSIDNKQAGRVLHLRYIDLLEWEEIAGILNYSKGYIFKLHKEGLNRIVK